MRVFAPHADAYAPLTKATPSSIEGLSSVMASASLPFSNSLSSPRPRFFSIPLTPSSIGVANHWQSATTSDSTYAHSTMPFSPFIARMSDEANWAPALAIERVAEPAPALAWTTSVPPFWMRCVRAATCSAESLSDTDGVAWLRSGRIEAPACPPTTGMLIVLTSTPAASATNVCERTMSSVVTPKIFLGSYVPRAFICSAKIGTVELTGLEMMATIALGQFFDTAVAKSWLSLALTANRSCRVIPGLRGTPAGITTISAPCRASSKALDWKSAWSAMALSPVNCAKVMPWPETVAGVSMCDRSAATPGAPTRSNTETWVTFWSSFRSSDMGCPIPPAPPTTQTRAWLAAEVESPRDTARTAVTELRENMVRGSCESVTGHV
eukprot:m.27515 g.27515  ORF g.27515 m.27515 type:complete len:382 (+) comp11930_c0_seq1:236-1381(+)